MKFRLLGVVSSLNRPHVLANQPRSKNDENPIASSAIASGFWPNARRAEASSKASQSFKVAVR